MKLGFLTACMPDRPLEEIAALAADQGYEALELAAWPAIGNRPFTASHVAADAFDEGEADRVRGALQANGLILSALAYYDNNLHPEAADREAIHAHVRGMHRCCGRARRSPGRHLYRSRSGPERRREPPGGRASLPAPSRLRRRARRKADGRELRHGGLAP